MNLSPELKRFLEYQKDTKNSVKADLIKQKISRLVLTKEQGLRPNPGVNIWDDNSLNRLRELEDLLFILSNNLATASNFETIFSNRNNYDGVLLRYMKERQNELENLDSFIILSRLAEYRNELINNLPQIRYFYVINPKHSLLRKAIRWIESNPQTDWGKLAINTYPHHTIFAPGKAFELFKFLLEEIGQKHLDISFIYRTMFIDEFIHQGSESQFRYWLENLEPYKITIKTKLQSFNHSKTEPRKRLYKSALKQFQLKSKTYP